MPPTDWTTPPFIGITTYGRDEGNKFALPAEYVDAVRRAGGIPLLVPPAEPHLDLLLAKLDGLILAGGGDLDPELYAGSPHETIYMVDPERDRSELAMARQVARRVRWSMRLSWAAAALTVFRVAPLIDALSCSAMTRAAIRSPSLRSSACPPGWPRRAP